MYSYVSLKVKCPKCDKSLMDQKNLVDEIPSIRLGIKYKEFIGTINMSAFYGSYNYTTDITIVPEHEYSFFCPHCKEDLVNQVDCSECKAKMIGLAIKEGGSVSFCSRAGCKKHNVKFDDLTNIHDYFHQNIGSPNIIDVQTQLEKEREKDLIKSGTFLQLYCPHCYQSNIEKNSVIFRIVNQNNEEGYLILSPYLNVFTNKSTIFIPEGAIAKDIQCPNCRESLIARDLACEECGAPAVEVFVAAMRKLIEFYFCSKKGCHWHSLSSEDLQHVILEDSDEW